MATKTTKANGRKFAYFVIGRLATATEGTAVADFPLGVGGGQRKFKVPSSVFRVKAKGEFPINAIDFPVIR